MAIQFKTIERPGNVTIVSDQLPDWRCTAHSRAAAEALKLGSLRDYLRKKRVLPTKIRRELTFMVGCGGPSPRCGD